MELSFWCAYDFLKDWQTLIGALIALGAAWRTISVMRRQGRDEDERYRKGLKRKEMASRARIPDALSNICQYCRDCFKYIGQEIEDIPDPSADSIEALKQAIEHIEDGAALRAFELVSFYQVQHVRLFNAKFPLNQASKDEFMYDSVLLYAYANSLFDYGRNEEKVLAAEAPKRGEMVTAFRNAVGIVDAGVNANRFEGMMRLIERRHED